MGPHILTLFIDRISDNWPTKEKEKTQNKWSFSLINEQTDENKRTDLNGVMWMRTPLPKKFQTY